MTSSASQTQTPRDVMPVAVFRDTTHDLRIVDVSDWPGPIDRSVVERMGDPVLVCFGDHTNSCPIPNAGEAGAVHGVVFEVRESGPRERAFLEAFTDLIDPAVPVRVTSRLAETLPDEEIA